MACYRGCACSALILAQLLGAVLSVTPSLPVALEHLGEACLAACGGLSGPCAYCGAAGGCCQRGNTSDVDQCNLASMRQYKLDGKDHECVLLPAELGSAIKPAIPAKMAGGKDCIGECKNMSGYCSSVCGAGNACCKPADMYDPLECRAVSLAEFHGDGYQCVQPPLDVSTAIEPLQNAGDKCSESCTYMGYCAWCGVGNACCRKSFSEGDPIECLNAPEDGFSRDDGEFECVVPLASHYDIFTAASGEDEEGSWKVHCAADCNGENLCVTDGFCSGEQTQSKQCPDYQPCTDVNATSAPCLPKDCEFGSWSEWAVAGCTGLCNRTRSFTPNECNGEPCNGELSETKSCESNCAPKEPCQLSEWSDWASCDDKDQKGRTRTVLSASRNGGAACNASLTETAYCDTRGPVDCVMGGWSPWSGCSTTCGAGQEFRLRSIATHAKHGGKPCTGTENSSLVTHETKECSDEPPCEGSGTPVDCELAEWGAWDTGACEGDCGQKFRKRGVKVPAQHGGKDCNETILEETAPCAGEDSFDVESLDCVLGNWSSWSLCSKTCGGGQTKRTRSVLKNAEAGGKPCESNIEEIKPCAEESCRTAPEASQYSNCRMDQWSDWGECSVPCGSGYVGRSRAILAPAYGEGLGCTASLSEVKPCPGSKECEPTDCKWAEWQEWGTCTLSCGRGTRTRQREVLAYPVAGGDLCDAMNSTLEVEGCNEDACPAACVDAKFADWSDWSGCSETCGGGMQFRNRVIGTQANHCGKSVDGNGTEIQECNTDRCGDDRDCELNDWGPWGSCSTACTGTKSRTRTIKVEGKGLGKWCSSSLEEVKSCNMPCSAHSLEGCEAAIADCKESSSCKQYLNHTNGSLVSTETILKMCDATDQLTAAKVLVQCPGYLADHTEDAIKCKALAAMKKLAIEQAESMGGTLLGKGALQNTNITAQAAVVASSAEVEVGNTSKANISNDVQAIVMQHPGFQAVAECKCTGVAKDCEIADWSDWSQCTASCGGGQKVRTREVLELPQGAGKECSEALKETDRCNEEVDCDTEVKACKWDSWEEWGHCSFHEATGNSMLRDCSGERTRTRKVKQEATQMGHSCLAKDSVELQECEKKCSYVHFCVWKDWAPEGKCSVTCGTNGVRKKVRELHEVSTRPLNESDIVAVVSTVADIAGCLGKEVAYEQCDDQPPCDACLAKGLTHGEDCDFADWSDWEPTTPCTGLCTRTREIKQNKTMCGIPCDGNLEESMVCANASTCSSRDCQMSTWSDWSSCDSPPDPKWSNQKVRSRKVTKPAAPGGGPCTGALEETEWCKEYDAVLNCTLSDWSEWDPCTDTCGLSYKKRSKTIKTEAAGGGIPCDGPMQEVAACMQKNCSDGADNANCAFSGWQDWAGCDGSSSEAYRKRSILTPPKGNGAKCTGAMKEVQACPANAPVDCEWKPWSDWGDCSATCQGGEHYRLREVAVHSKNGGSLCTGSYREMKACSEVPCNPDADCELGDWGDWGSCQSTTGCGEGYQVKTRQVTRGAQDDGVGCGAALSVAQTCDAGACKNSTDCAWSDWADWGECAKAAVCGLGHRTRKRTIAVEPTNGGKLCLPEQMEEVSPDPECPGSCDEDCVDGLWSDWEEWSSCSVSCGPGGHRHHLRKLLKEANSCGKPAEGENSEYESCTVQECAGVSDCVFSEWKNDTECVHSEGNATNVSDCNTFQTMSRTIATPASNGGAGCGGSLIENRRCIPKDAFKCRGQTVDCKLSGWTEWGSCDTDCGQGHKSRQREVLQYPMFGGEPCEPSLKEIEVCNVATVCKEHEVVDCKLSDWTGQCRDTPGWNSSGVVSCVDYEKFGWCVDGGKAAGFEEKFGEAANYPENNCCVCGGGNSSLEGACNGKTGQLTKVRTVLQEPKNGGKPCDGPFEETEPCAVTCTVKAQYCSWGDWEDWGACSTACGPAGRVSRKRRLELSAAPKATAVAKFDTGALGQLEALSSQHHQNLAVAFVSGAATLVLALGIMRFACRSRSAEENGE